MKSIPTAEEHLKHLDFLQATIARLASNSFALRGWSVTLVAGLFALASKGTNPDLAVISYLPVVAFWILDAYYVLQERRFRLLFNRVAAKDQHILPFSLNAKLVDLSPAEGVKTLFSGPLLFFHGSLLITVTIVTILFRFKAKM